MPRRTCLVVAVAILSALALTACTDSEDSTAGAGTERADEGELVHVHDALVGAGGTPVYLPAHTGL